MMTVQEVADSYGVSTAFMARALDKIGFKDAQLDTALSTVTLTRFEARFGTGIREAQAKQPQTPPSQPVRRQPKPHVMRVAHAKVGAGRDAARNRVTLLLNEPGIVHAIDAAGTNDGDPWREVVPGAVHFFGGAMNSGPPAACGWQHMRAVLGDEFVPADDPVRSNQCPRCAAVVADGKGFRTPPHEREHRSYFCDVCLRIRIDGSVTVKDCSRRDFHNGPHRARDGAEWDIGVDDHVPASDEVGRDIAKAS